MLAGSAWAGGDEGWFGIGVKADGEGRFWNPVIHSLLIDNVEDGSPAQAAGLAIGDSIVQVGAQAVEGQRLRALQPFFEKRPGETLHLTLVRKNGARYEANMVALDKPQAE